MYDKLVGAFLLIIGGLLTCVFVGYRILPEADRELAQGLDHVTARQAGAGFVRYVAPPVLIVVSFFSFGDVITAFRALF